MKPAPFKFIRATSVEHALGVLTSEEDAKIIAGGQSLIAMMNLRLARPRCLIDINRLSDLDYIRENGDVIAIGALARHNTIKRSPLVAAYCPLLTEAYGLIANHTVRNRGTLGGNVCHADPASESPAVLLATEATLVARSLDRERKILAEDFFRGIFETGLDDTELLTEIRVPKKTNGAGWAILEVCPQKGGFAVAAVAVMLSLDGDTCKRLRLAVAGVGDKAQRIGTAEETMEGKALDESRIQTVASLVRDAIDPQTDQHADGAYRRDIVFTLTQRAIRKAIERAGKGD